jgi:ribonuclease HI
MIRKLLLRFHDLLKTKSVKLYWISSHVGIRGNEKVDALAKQSTNFQKTDLLLPAYDLKIAKYRIPKESPTRQN